MRQQAQKSPWIASDSPHGEKHEEIGAGQHTLISSRLWPSRTPFARSTSFFGYILVLFLVISVQLGPSEKAPRVFVEATLEDHKNLIYTLPRPGVEQLQDCYVNMYGDDLLRDLAIMKEMGVTTIMTRSGWNVGMSHSVLLSTMASYNMTLGLTFFPDLNGVMRQNLAKLKKELSQYKVALEWIYLNYPIDFDNVDQFFRWVIQVRSWMNQQGFTSSSLFVRFFPQVSNPKTVQALLQQWDEGDFTAWAVEAYSADTMDIWLNKYMVSLNKQLFFLYGADSWNLTANNQTLQPQKDQLGDLLDFVTATASGFATVPSESNISLPISGNMSAHLLSGAIQGYADTWYLGQDPNYFQGGANDVCPDLNPYLHTSCGGNDPNIIYGDEYYSVEHMGVMKEYETIYYFRCLEPTPSALLLQTRWNAHPNTKALITPYCTLSLSVPYIYVFYIWGGGLAVALLALLIGCCKARCCSSTPSSSPCCCCCCLGPSIGAKRRGRHKRNPSQDATAPADPKAAATVN